jgi:hypothetical protein
MTNLIPTQGQKSFYNKAKLETFNNTTYLISYTTQVAFYNHKTQKMTVKGYYSQTTAKHINSFLEMYGFKRCNKKELENYNK